MHTPGAFGRRHTLYPMNPALPPERIVRTLSAYFKNGVLDSASVQIVRADYGGLIASIMRKSRIHS